MTLPGFPQHLINRVQAASVVQKGKANENTHSDQLHRYATNYCERTALQQRLTGPALKQTSPARSESKQDISITVMSVIFSCSTRMGKTSARLSVYHAAASSICSEVTSVSLVPLDSEFQPGAAGERTRVRRDQADYLRPTSGRRERSDRAFGPGRVSVCQVSSFSVSS